MKKNKLLAAFASVSMMFSSPVAAQDDTAAPLKTTAPAANSNVKSCPIPENLSGGRLYKERVCVSLKDFLKNPERYKSQRNYKPLMTMYNSSAMGRGMIMSAANDGVTLCDMKLSKNNLGVNRYNLRQIGIDYDQKKNEARNLATLAHELAHNYQFVSGVRYYDVKRSMEENQKTVLAMEAAAPTAEVIILFKADQSGEINWRRDLDEWDFRYSWLEKFDKHYKRAIKVFYSEQDAINYAANIVWKEVLKTPYIQESYNTNIARFTLLRLKYLKASDLYHISTTVETTVNLAGKFNDNVDFTSIKDMPSSDKLYQSDKMRKLHEALEWFRQKKMRGENDDYVKRYYQFLKENGNDYVDVDIADMECKVSQGQNVLQAFDDAIKNKFKNITFSYNIRGINKNIL